MLIGHIDTVFPKGTVNERPFRQDGNIVYGPGVFDMKHGSLLILYLMQELPREVFEKLNIVVVFNPDEEIGSPFSKDSYKKYAQKTEYAFVYEGASSNMTRCVERKGRLSFDVEIKGRSGHCGFVFTNGALSAISEMARWIVSLDSLQSREKNTTVNIGVAHGGIKRNVVASDAYFEVDIRIPNADELDRAEKMLSELVLRSENAGYKIYLKNKKASLPMTLSEKGKIYMKQVGKTAESIGQEFKYSLRGGLSDANYISQFGAVCIDAMGPAGGKDHSPDEYMLVDSVIPSFDFSMALIKDLAKNK